MGLYLAVDGGQTATRVVLADGEGRLLAQGAGGPSNHTEEPGGPERLENVIRTTLIQALAFASLPPMEDVHFDAACFGMTGETEIKEQVLRRMVHADRLLVVHDSVNAFEGATGGEPGVMVIAGTGSVARGRNAEGQELRVGGWGHLFGDEGSGYWIGREAVRAVLAEHDQIGEKTRLTSMLLRRLELTSAYELKDSYYAGKFSRDHLAGLAVWVDEAARTGDRVAKGILKRAGGELAALAHSILSRLFSKNKQTKTAARRVLVSFSGGVFKSRAVRRSFAADVQSLFHRAKIQRPLFPPVLGSLLVAYRLTGVSIPHGKLANWPRDLADLVEPA